MDLFEWQEILFDIHVILINCINLLTKIVQYLSKWYSSVRQEWLIAKVYHVKMP